MKMWNGPNPVPAGFFGIQTKLLIILFDDINDNISLIEVYLNI
jgi:hypothetical protein